MLLSRFIISNKRFHCIVCNNTIRSNHWDHRTFLPYDVSEVQKIIEEDQQWIKLSPVEKAKALEKFTVTPPQSPIASLDIIEYIKKRNELEELQCNSAIRLLSSLLTFPLSLSYGLSNLYCIDDALLATRGRRLNVLLVGARSESSLPARWWREFLFHCSRNSSELLHHASVHMVGPGLQPNYSLNRSDGSISSSIRHNTSGQTIDKTIELINNISKLSSQSQKANGKHEPDSVTVHACTRSQHSSSKSSNSNLSHQGVQDACLLHDHPNAVELLRWADVFMLYNPGLGTEKLRKSWDPTVRLLLQTRKPIICTAYGDFDLRRDLNFIDSISAEEDDQDFGEPLEFVIPPHENPYKSFKRTVDEREEGDCGIITTNHSIYAFQAK